MMTQTTQQVLLYNKFGAFYYFIMQEHDHTFCIFTPCAEVVCSVCYVFMNLTSV